MFKFIKKFFAKEEIKEERVELNELNSWLDEKTKPLFEDLNNNINQIIDKINNEKEKVNENIKTLENAKLQNPKIPERVKTIMEGNRAAFIKKVTFFFDNLNFEKKQDFPADQKSAVFSSILEKCNKLKHEIDALGKSTVRSYQVLNEFFAREAENIAINIKKVENYSKDIENSVKNSKISIINKIKDNVVDIQNKIKLREKNSNYLESNKNSLQDNKNKKTGIENKNNEIKSSSDYENYEKLLEEKNKLESQINDIENRLFHDFSVLEKALKKYAKIAFENEKLILEYLGNTISTLIKDTNFTILKILDSLKNAISRNEFDLDEKKKEKALAKINELDGVYFTKIKDDFENAKQRLNDIGYKIENNESNKELVLNSKELENVKLNIENLNNNILNISNELEKINIENLKEELQREVNDVANTKITIL